MTERDELRPEHGDVDFSGPAPAGIPIEPDAVEAPAQERPQRTLKGAAVLSARVVAGVAGAVVAAAVLAATILVPLPTLSNEPPAVTVTPVAAQQQRVCAGPLLRLGDDSGAQATTATALGDPALTSDASEGSVDVTEVRDANAPGTSSAIVALPTRDGEENALLAASQSQSVSRGDFVGTAAAECLEPRDDTWLVGGATTTGRTTLLTIVNPGEVTATVDVTVHSDAGPIVAPGMKGVAIPPTEQRVFSLAGLAPGLSTPVVRVESHGALVVASMQQSVVRTLAPGGLDYITGSVAPSTRLSIPGIILPDHELLEEAIAGEDYLDLMPALRLLVPGDAQAHAVVTMIPVTAAGRATGEAPVDISVTLDPGSVTELPVGEFEAGRYVAAISSDVPVVAGMRVTTVNDDGDNDFAWLPAVEPLERGALVAVARGSAPVMTLHNPSDEAAEVALSGGTGSGSITVPAGTAVSVSVAANTVYRLDGFDELHVAVDFVGDGTITAHSASPRAPASTPIRVYP